MSLMTLTILILLAGGLVSLILFRKAKKLQWILFFMSAAYSTAATILLYGKWELAETFRTEFFNLHLANTKMGWLFLAASTIVTLLISIFSLSYNDKKHATGIAPLWTMLLAAIFIIRKATGSFSIAESVNLLALQWQEESALLYSLVILLSLAFFTKSAIAPFYMWPAKAHAEAPDDFSAFLSGIMIKL